MNDDEEEQHWDGDCKMADDWKPMPAGWCISARRVVMRNSGDSPLSWLVLPDSTGYAGLALELVRRASPPSEFWIWTDESADRVARIVRLGYRRYVVELYGDDTSVVAERPEEGAVAQRINDQERDVLGRGSVAPAQVIESAVVAESCVSLWLRHGLLHDGFEPRER